MNIVDMNIGIKRGRSQRYRSYCSYL